MSECWKQRTFQNFDLKRRRAPPSSISPFISIQSTTNSGGNTSLTTSCRRSTDRSMAKTEGYFQGNIVAEHVCERWLTLSASLCNRPRLRIHDQAVGMASNASMSTSFCAHCQIPTTKSCSGCKDVPVYEGVYIFSASLVPKFGVSRAPRQWLLSEVV